MICDMIRDTCNMLLLCMRHDVRQKEHRMICEMKIYLKYVISPSLPQRQLSRLLSFAKTKNASGLIFDPRGEQREQGGQGKKGGQTRIHVICDRTKRAWYDMWHAIKYVRLYQVCDTVGDTCILSIWIPTY